MSECKWKRVSINTIPAKDWQLICPLLENGVIVGLYAEDVIGFVVEVDEHEDDAKLLVTSTAFGVTGVPDGETALQSPTGVIQLPYEREFSTRAELLAYWRSLPRRKTA